MGRYILYIILAAIAVYLSVNIFQLYTAQRGLANVPAGYATGPESADLTVVEFLSYSCRYCREVHPTITEAVKRDGNIRYIPRPVGSGDSESMQAAKIVYAAGEQGKFIEMHNALIENYRVVDEDALVELSRRVGVDVNELNKALGSGGGEKRIKKNTKLFLNIGGQATPTFIIGGEIIYVPEGQMPLVDDFLAMFAEARAMQ